MTNDIFRTVRELLVNRDELLLSNAVDTEGKLYADSVENLTAILAMKDSYAEMLAALEALLDDALTLGLADSHLSGSAIEARAAIAKAKGKLTCTN
jgi:hypothetical protein